MVLWRRFVSARFESFIYGRKRWYSVLSGGVVRFRGSMVLEEPFPSGSPMFCYTHLRYFMSSGQANPKPKAEGKGGDWRKPKVENDGGIRINEAINDREVRLVTEQGHRVVSIQEALYLAKKLDLDLVEVQRKVKVEGGTQSAVFKPAVCKLMDYCKEKYKQDMKGKERAKSKSFLAELSHVRRSNLTFASFVSTFANRDVPAAAVIISYCASDIVWNPIGPTWRMLRRICVREMLNPNNLDAIYHLRRRELRSAIRQIHSTAISGEVVDVGAEMFLSVLNIITGMLWGGTLEGEEERSAVGKMFRHLVGEITVLLGRPNVSDFIPALSTFDLQGIVREMKVLKERFDGIFARIIEMKRDKGLKDEKKVEENMDFLDYMLMLEKKGNESKEPFTINHVKALLMAAIALRNGENKEVRFKAKTELKDLKIKAESVKRLMERGYRVKCTAMPTGKGDGDLGGLLLNLLSLIEDISIVESGPHLDTKNAYVIVKHIKFASKKGKKVSKAVETISSVLSTRSDAGVDNNNASKDEDDCHTEEEWEAVESDSETEIYGPSNQFKTNTPNLSGLQPSSPPKVVGNGFGAVTDWSGANTTDDIKAEITFNTKHTSSSVTMSTSDGSINTASRRNAAGFYPSQTESYVTEINRYSKGSNSSFHQIRPTNQDRFSPRSAIGNQRRIPEQSNKREVESCGQSKPNDRPANYNPNSAASGHGVCSASQSSGSNDRNKAGGATKGTPNAPNVPRQRYGVFSSTKTSSSLDGKHMNEISNDRLSKSNSPTTSNYGIFSAPKAISSEDQMKQRVSTRDNSIKVAPSYVDNGKSSNAGPPSPRFGIFTSSKKIPSGEDRVGDKN